jgi:DNA-binding NarL/FixJ family response regulator
VRIKTNRDPASQSGHSKNIHRVLLVDDHELLRDGVIEMLANKTNLEVCGEADSESDAMALVGETHPHLAIVDISLKQGDGISLTKRIKALDESIRVIVYSTYDEDLYGERALRAGASGYVNKQAPAAELTEAIGMVLGGSVYLSPKMASRLVTATQTGVQPGVLATDTLSDRELEVFRLIGNGLMNAQIADQLHISPRTVETYRERLKLKLDVQTSAELNRRAVQWVLQGE